MISFSHEKNCKFSQLSRRIEKRSAQDHVETHFLTVLFQKNPAEEGAGRGILYCPKMVNGSEAQLWSPMLFTLVEKQRRLLGLC